MLNHLGNFVPEHISLGTGRQFPIAAALLKVVGISRIRHVSFYVSSPELARLLVRAGDVGETCKGKEIHLPLCGGQNCSSLRNEPGRAYVIDPPDDVTGSCSDET